MARTVREGRAGTAAILACRLIDRPLRPSFVKGLRNEVQVVETVLAIHPDDDYDVLAINAASMSTQIAGLPFSGPVAGEGGALLLGVAGEGHPVPVDEGQAGGRPRARGGAPLLRQGPAQRGPGR